METRFTPSSDFQGYHDLVHGGITSALLDECLGWVVSVQKRQMHVTGELNIRYIKPMKTGGHYIVKAYFDFEKTTKKTYSKAYGYVEDDEGTVYAKGSGTFFPISREREREVLSEVLLEGSDEISWDVIGQISQPSDNTL